MIEVKPVVERAVGEAAELFDSDPVTRNCYCMWFLVPVKEFHANGHEGNARLFGDLAAGSGAPVGLLAHRDGEAVGWCATGPRSRYARAILTPTFRGRDPSEDDEVWMVPCFYVRPDARRGGVSRALLEGAVALARRHGAAAVEGFPFARGAKLGRESMVGVEAVFEACGFVVTRRPSAARVVMRLDLKDAG